MRTGYGIVAIAAGGCTAALAGQVVAPKAGDTGPDIIVEGGTPRMVAGLWRFQSGTEHDDPTAGQRAAPPRRGKAWERCIDDGDTAAILNQLIGDKAWFDAGSRDGTLCSALNLAIQRAHVSGSRRCTMMTGVTSAYYVTTRLHARIAETRLVADYVLQGSSARGRARTTRWQVTAERIGACPGSAPTPVATPAPAPVAAPEPQLAIVQDQAAQPIDRAAVPKQAVATPAQPDDIVVIARKLRRLRLHYASSGKAMRWCHADITSGDPRLDRIGCAMVRACVKEGFDEPAPALACVNRKVDSLVPVGGVLAKE